MSDPKIAKTGEAQINRQLDEDELDQVSGGNSMRHYFYRLTHTKVSRGKMLLDQFMQAVQSTPGAKKR